MEGYPLLFGSLETSNFLISMPNPSLWESQWIIDELNITMTPVGQTILDTIRLEKGLGIAVSRTQ